MPAAKKSPDTPSCKDQYWFFEDFAITSLIEVIDGPHEVCFVAKLNINITKCFSVFMQLSDKVKMFLNATSVYQVVLSNCSRV